MKEPTQICRGFTDEQWKDLRKRLILDGELQDDQTAWTCAVDVFARRITERFFSCIEVLERADAGSDVDVPPGAPPDSAR